MNVIVGTSLGRLKDVTLLEENGVWKSDPKRKKVIQPENDVQAVTALAWANATESLVLVGHTNQVVRLYDTNTCLFGSSFKVTHGTGPVCGVFKDNGIMCAAVQSGVVEVLGKNEIIDTKGHLEKMRKCPARSIMATGGKEQELQLWDINQKTCIFTAKKVRNDYLELRVPLWVTDIQFMNSQTVALCSKYGHVRVYDPRHQQRRPVFDFHIPDEPLTACSVASDQNMIIVGSGRGYMAAVDIRRTGKICHTYKGSSGCIRSIVCHPTQPYVFSVGLDRFLNLHSIEKPKLLYREFMNTKLQEVLIHTNFRYQEKDNPKNETATGDEDNEIICVNEETESNAEAYNDLFSKMEPVEENHEESEETVEEKIHKKPKRSKKNHGSVEKKRKVKK